MSDEENVDRVTVAGVLALTVFGLLLLSGRSGDLLPSPARLGLFLALPLIGIGFWWTRRISVVLGFLVIGGVLLRMVDFPPGGAGGSDVLAAVNEGIGVLLGGGNPYDHVYQATRPAGQPLPYPPGALLLHLPGHLWSGLYGVQMTEVVLAAGGMLLLGGAGWLVGSWLLAAPAVALYAGLGNLVNLSVDGSNDTGTGVLLLATLVGLVWAVRHGASATHLATVGLLAGLALASKQSALPLAVLPAAYLWRSRGSRAAVAYLGGMAALFGLLSLPFVIMNPAAYLRELFSFAGVHADVYGWNIWTLAANLQWPVWDLRSATLLSAIIAMVGLLVALAAPYRRLGAAVLAGLLVTLLVFFSSRWTTYAYFAMLAPVALVIPLLFAADVRPRSAAPTAVAAA
jgi:hypothetical protein